jgi:hypothetical protein
MQEYFLILISFLSIFTDELLLQLKIKIVQFVFLGIIIFLFF